MASRPPVAVNFPPTFASTMDFEPQKVDLPGYGPSRSASRQGTEKLEPDVPTSLDLNRAFTAPASLPANPRPQLAYEDEDEDGSEEDEDFQGDARPPLGQDKGYPQTGYGWEQPWTNADLGYYGGWDAVGWEAYSMAGRGHAGHYGWEHPEAYADHDGAVGGLALGLDPKGAALGLRGGYAASKAVPWGYGEVAGGSTPSAARWAADDAEVSSEPALDKACMAPPPGLEPLLGAEGDYRSDHRKLFQEPDDELRGVPAAPSLGRAHTEPLGPKSDGWAGILTEEPPPQKAQTLVIEKGARPGGRGLPGDFQKVRWVVDARKLRGSDKVTVSPSFELADVPGRFRIMLLPKAVSDRKGGASFKKAKGKGYVQLKCEAELEEGQSASMELELSCSVWSGSSGQDEPQATLGPVPHNFAENSICTFGIRQQDEWNFSRAVDEASQTFEVSMEIAVQNDKEPS